jgi:hypothetical protein
VQKKPKSNSVVTSEVRDGVIVVTVLRGGAQGENVELRLDPKAVHEANRVRAMQMGLISRIVDRAAKSRDTTNGAPASPHSKYLAMKEIVEHLASGAETWGPERATSGRAPGLDSILVAALCEATGQSRDEILERIGRGAEKRSVTKSAYLAAACEAATVKPIVERMRAEQAAGLGDEADELLDEMMGGEAGEMGVE